MCGIAGYIDASLSSSERDALLEKMLSAIAHRGPDARGKWIDGPVALGHNRLAIIDLSDDGLQPMQRGELQMVFNGEIYNYLEIKDELIGLGHAFRSHSDSEVILAAFQQWGTDCVQRFMGMWAFAIWDVRKQELFCSRDRFGIKPFHYILKSGRFYFGSEYKALKSTPLFSNDLNIAQVSRGLQLGWNTYADETYFECIATLPAATNLIYKEGKIKLERYWDLSTLQHQMKFEDAKEKFRSLFLDSIQLHMRADVEVGGCLSGGLDSSAIASAVGTLYPDVRFQTFNVFYEGKDAVDERPWVKEVLSKYPSLVPHYFTPTDKEIEESFAHAIYHADVPVAGSSPISQYFVMQLARKNGIKVLLDGQGADESLGGYLHGFYRLIGGMMSRGQLSGAFKELNGHAARQDYSGAKRVDLLVKSLLSSVQSEEKLYDLEYRRYLPFLPKSKSKVFKLEQEDGSALNKFLYHLINTTLLPTLLQFEDRNSMAFSIESRVPFLDHRIVEFAFSLPDACKMHNGVTKRVLREGMRGILPDAIADRKDKKGFVTPGEVKWLRGPLKHLLEQDFGHLDFLNQTKVKQVVDAFKAGDNTHATLVWRLVVLRYWMTL
jgi:asparagine synthase (glutamine-hydrolysing)